MKPLAKRKMKKVLILLIITFALIAVSYPGYAGYLAIRSHSSFGSYFDVGMYLAIFFGSIAVLATLYFAFFFAERGRKAAAAVFATPWLVFGLYVLLSGIQGVIGAYWRNWWLLPEYLSVGALGVIVYLFAWFSMKWKNNVLFIMALIFTFMGAATVIGDTVQEVIRSHDYIAAETFLIPSAEIAAFVLIGLAICFGVKRDDREPLYSNASMFPELDAYRKSLRKERA